MSCIWVVILTDGAQAGGETFELVELLNELRAVSSRELAEKYLFGVARVSGVECAVLNVSHALVKLLFGDVECLAESKRVKIAHFSHAHENIVGWLVEDE